MGRGPWSSPVACWGLAWVSCSCVPFAKSPPAPVPERRKLVLGSALVSTLPARRLGLPRSAHEPLTGGCLAGAGVAGPCSRSCSASSSNAPSCVGLPFAETPAGRAAPAPHHSQDASPVPRPAPTRDTRAGRGPGDLRVVGGGGFPRSNYFSVASAGLCGQMGTVLLGIASQRRWGRLVAED